MYCMHLPTLGLNFGLGDNRLFVFLLFIYLLGDVSWSRTDARYCLLRPLHSAIRHYQMKIVYQHDRLH